MAVCSLGAYFHDFYKAGDIFSLQNWIFGKSEQGAVCVRAGEEEGKTSILGRRVVRMWRMADNPVEKLGAVIMDECS